MIKYLKLCLFVFKYRGIQNNKDFMLLKKDIEERKRKEKSKSKRSEEKSYEESFIDKTRNVGVVLGEKDIKQDVKEKMGKSRKLRVVLRILRMIMRLCARGNFK